MTIKKINLFFFLFCFFASFQLQSQYSPYALIKEMEQKCIFVETDLFGNIYLSDGSVIYKYNKTFQLQNTYSDFSTGKIHSMDVGNPMKILVFSKEFMRITFINNQLAKQNKPLLLSDKNIILPSAACISYNNGFWIYDAMKDVLLRFDDGANKVIESQVLTSLIGEKISVDCMREIDGKYLIISSKNYGFYIFDIFGTFIKYIPSKGMDNFSIWNSKLVYVSENAIHVLTIETIDNKTYTLPETDTKQIAIQGNHLVTLSSSGIVKIYGFSE